MAFECKILADSLAPCGKRLTTFEVTYPRIIHSEVLTHRMLSRNSASSRAIPVEKLLNRIEEDPFIPLYIGANQKGMQAGEELSEADRAVAVGAWLTARDFAVNQARGLARLGVHKQVVNRLIEPWMWITVIISATEWDNFYGLRCHKDAEPHFQHIARMMQDAQMMSSPRVVTAGDLHLPMIKWDDEIDQKLSQEDLIKVAVGRCARVSYLTHHGVRDINEDISLHDRMAVQEPLHASPTEHVASALAEPERSGNFIGWRQYRKSLPNEHIGGPMP